MNELETALAYHRSGAIKEAEAIYCRVLAADSQNGDALHLYGMLRLQTGAIEEGARLIAQAAAAAPQNPLFQSSLGLARYRQGNIDAAIACYAASLRLNPNAPEVHHNLGLAFRKKGDVNQAVACYQQALHLKPDYVEAWNNLGGVYSEHGLGNQARECFQTALRFSPHNPQLYYNLARVWQSLSDFSQAIAAYQQALALKPDYAEALVGLGKTLFLAQRFSEALPPLASALSLKPGACDIHNLLGTVKYHSGDTLGAIACFSQAISLNPNFADALSNLGNVYSGLRQEAQAKTCYQRSLRVNPHNPEVWNNLGTICQSQGYLGEAVDCYRRALALRPDFGTALSNLAGQLRMLCHWTEVQEVEARLDQLTDAQLKQGHKPDQAPFLSLLRSFDQSRHLAIACAWSRELARIAAKSKPPFDFSQRPQSSQLKIGYLSYDFRNHPVGHLVFDLFRAHDRAKTTVYVYSYSADDGSLFRRKIREGADVFVDLQNMNSLQAATRIYQDHIDILVDMTGYTTGNRFDITAYRPAPILVSYLGFPGTTGADFIDYLITDRELTPASHASHYTEKFVYLPDCYQVHSRVAPLPGETRRQDWGLPEHGFVFCSFNAPYKIEPVIFGAWMRILTQTPDSVLWLQEPTVSARKHLLEAASGHGVAPNRIIFSPKIPLPDHLARLKLADLALDTRIYNGGATTANALMVGLPLVTIQGEHYVSRMSSSLLCALGFPELATNDLDAYQSLAIRLALAPQTLHALKERLAEKVATSPLFNIKRFAAALETAYAQMQRRYGAGEPPTMIMVYAQDPGGETAGLEFQAASSAQDLGNEGIRYLAAGKLTSAIWCFNAALTYQPNLPEAYANIGLACQRQGQQPEAIAALEHALSLKADLPEAHNSLGIIYRQRYQFDKAAACFQQALKYRPDFYQAWYNLGNALQGLGLAESAIKAYEQALRHKPDYAVALNNLAHLLQYLCDWERCAALAPNLDELTREALNSGEKPAETPLINISRHIDPQLNYRVARAWSHKISRKVAGYGLHFDHRRAFKPEPRLIVVGYLSNDFRNHPVSHLLLGLFKHRDRRSFRFHCYSYGVDDNSSYRRQMEELSDSFVDISLMGDVAAAERIYADGVHILVDLMGYTANSRMEILALKPAPIQATYLGFPGTTGADFIDYMIADRQVSPESHAPYYSEKLSYMPDCYMAFDHSQPIAATQYRRADFGLPETGVVFCMFNSSHKIEPVIFQAWMNILAKTPSSVLWLPQFSAITQRHLLEQAKNYGIAPQRFIVADRLPEKADHLARLKLADLALDTRIYNGHVSTLDALWAGIPVITTPGGHFASRVSASILRTAGLPELIAPSLEAYQSLAIELALNQNKLQLLKDKLVQAKHQAPVFDSVRIAHDLEALYREMVKNATVD